MKNPEVIQGVGKRGRGWEFFRIIICFFRDSVQEIVCFVVVVVSVGGGILLLCRARIHANEPHPLPHLGGSIWKRHNKTILKGGEIWEEEVENFEKWQNGRKNFNTRNNWSTIFNRFGGRERYNDNGRRKRKNRMVMSLNWMHYCHWRKVNWN